MKILLDSIVFEVDDALLSPGSLLHTLLHTKITNVEKEGDAFVISDVTIEGMVSYLDFLNFRTDFEWNETIASDFDYLGHSNLLQYPLDFWKVKLIDDRVREFFSTHPQKQLLPLHPDIGMEGRIRKVLECLVGGKLPDDHYIAGGAALYIAGITDRFNDIDIFSCNRKLSTDYIKTVMNQLNGDSWIYASGHAITYHYQGSYTQLILREYSCPSEIVHGFDLGSCSVIFDGTDVWTTVKGMYCIRNHVNWFEPDRSSPTYALRLAKYHCRGFKIMLPMTEGIGMSDYTNQLEARIMDFYYSDIKYEGVEVDDDNGYIINIEVNVKELYEFYLQRLGHAWVEQYRIKERLVRVAGRMESDIDIKMLAKYLTDNNLKGYNDKGNEVPFLEQLEEYKHLINQVPNEYCRYWEINRYMHKDIKYLPRLWDYETSIVMRECAKYALIHQSSDPAYQSAAAAYKLAKEAINTLKAYLYDPSWIRHIDDMISEYEVSSIEELHAIEEKFEALIFPKDPMSIILLSSVYGYLPGLYLKNSGSKKTDYDTYKPRRIDKIGQVDELVWKIHNPMEQLTGTFYPEPIADDIRQFYLSSPLVMEDPNSGGIQSTSYFRSNVSINSTNYTPNDIPSSPLPDNL